MRLINLKKYFFANLVAIWSYVLLFLLINYELSVKKYPVLNPNEIVSPGVFDLLFVFYAFIILSCLIAFFIFEILIRKHIIDKKFQNFKLNIKIKLPKLVSILYKILFYIGIMLAGIYVLLLGIFMLFSLFD